MYKPKLVAISTLEVDIIDLCVGEGRKLEGGLERVIKSWSFN